MSYSVSSPCYNCRKKEVCTDPVKVQEAVNSIHQDCISIEKGHMGAGTIAIQCVRLDAIDK